MNNKSNDKKIIDSNYTTKQNNRKNIPYNKKLSFSSPIYITSILKQLSDIIYFFQTHAVKEKLFKN